MIIMVGCAGAPAKKEAPPPIAKYNFKFNPPENSNKKSGITIGVLEPLWDENIGLDKKTPYMDAYINPDPNEMLRLPNLTAHPTHPPKKIVEISKEFHNAISVDLEAMMIARGFTTMGPFLNIEEMTYPQKEACNLVIRPEFSQQVISEPHQTTINYVSGNANIRTAVVLRVYEPLSNEKLWIKRYTHKSNAFPYEVKYDYATMVNKSTKKKVGYQRKGIRWDNREAGYAKAMEELYIDLMQKSWNYFNPDEISVLKTHSDEIRKKKRF
jgi:hypothetical protein